MRRRAHPKAITLVLASCALGGAALAHSEPSGLPRIGLALAGESAAKTVRKGDTAAASRAIAEYEGVYKKRFKNALVDGSKYDSEDILEIVRYGDDTVYFRTNLEFFNGHLCGLYGIAKYEDGAFLFTESKPMAATPPCKLRIKLSKGEVVFLDEGGSCKNSFCGARGIFDGASFPYKAKRKIRYMERLKKSREYEEAVRDYEEWTKGK